MRLDETGSRREIAEVRAELVAALERVAAHEGAWAAADHGHDELDALEARLAELAAIAADTGRLGGRVAEMERFAAATPKREEFASLYTRVDELAALVGEVAPNEAIAAVRGELEGLRQAAARAESGAGARLTDLGRRLEETAGAVAELVAAEEAGASAVDRSELERLEATVDAIRASAREAADAAQAALDENAARSDADAAARSSLESDLLRRIDGLGEQLGGDLAGVGSRVDGLAAELATTTRDLVRSGDVEQALEASEVRLHERLAAYDEALAAYDEALAALRARQEEIAVADGALGRRLSGVESSIWWPVLTRPLPRWSTSRHRGAKRSKRSRLGLGGARAQRSVDTRDAAFTADRAHGGRLAAGKRRVDGGGRRTVRLRLDRRRRGARYASERRRTGIEP